MYFTEIETIAPGYYSKYGTSTAKEQSRALVLLRLEKRKTKAPKVIWLAGRRLMIRGLCLHAVGVVGNSLFILLNDGALVVQLYLIA